MDGIVLSGRSVTSPDISVLQQRDTGLYVSRKVQSSIHTVFAASEAKEV